MPTVLAQRTSSQQEAPGVAVRQFEDSLLGLGSVTLRGHSKPHGAEHRFGSVLRMMHWKFSMLEVAFNPGYLSGFVNMPTVLAHSIASQQDSPDTAV